MAAVPPSDAPDPGTPPSPSADVSPRAAAAAQVAAHAASILRRVADFCRRVVLFYWSHREGLWRRYATASQDSREIELSAERNYPTASYDETGWTVRLPACCLVCGQDTDAAETRETFAVDELTQPLWMAVGGLGIALIASWWLGTFWVFPLVILGGLALGYLSRRQVEIRVDLRRCDEHRDVRTVPRLRLSGNDLVLGTGQKRVVERFEAANRKKTPKQRPVEEEPVPDLPPIPLADSGEMPQVDGSLIRPDPPSESDYLVLDEPPAQAAPPITPPPEDQPPVAPDTTS